MGFITDSETHPLLSVEERSESFKIHRGGLSYGEYGEQHIELPYGDLPHLLVLLQGIVTRKAQEIADVPRYYGCVECPHVVNYWDFGSRNTWEAHMREAHGYTDKDFSWIP